MIKRKFIRSFFITLSILLLTALTHFLIFPQETKCILIKFADFNKTGNMYYRPSTAMNKIESITRFRSLAEKRVKDFWGTHATFNYKIIYCNNEKDFNAYGHEGVPAATQLKLGAYVVLQDQSLDVDIISHEIAHTVLYNNIGWYKTKFKIPTWFDEGLAMQVDNRDYYSIDSLLAKKAAGIKIPDVTLLKKPSDFFAGTTNNIMLNFSTAKFVVHEWLKTHSLKKFIDKIKNGDSFEKACE